MTRWHVRFAFVPRDLWIGLFIGEQFIEMGHFGRTFYVCLIPTLVIKVTRYVRIPETWA